MTLDEMDAAEALPQLDAGSLVDRERLEAAVKDMYRVLRPGGRLAITDIVSGRALKEHTRRNVELWAACIAGAIPHGSYLKAIEANGLEVQEVRKNDYRFASGRALEACSTYAVESISLVARKSAITEARADRASPR
jgi:arsenite methyltransferase